MISMLRAIHRLFSTTPGKAHQRTKLLVYPVSPLSVENEATAVWHPPRRVTIGLFTSHHLNRYSAIL